MIMLELPPQYIEFVHYVREFSSNGEIAKRIECLQGVLTPSGGALEENIPPVR
jgi:hypothetical protein